jgi:hypothetical protein
LPTAAGGGDGAPRLADLFGEYSEQLLRQTDPDVTADPAARLAPVGEALLWQPPWLERFRAAGRVAHVQAAQNEIGVTQYLDRVLPIARGLGLTTARGLALLLDRAVHAGVGGGLAWVMDQVGPIRSEADRDAALRAVIGGSPDLAELQRRQGLAPTGVWDVPTHAALTGALRRLGPAAPIPVPEPEAMIRALLQAASAAPFGARMQALADNTQELDPSIPYDLD